MNAVTQESPEQAARRLAATAISKGYALTGLHEHRSADGSPWCWRIRCEDPKGAKWMRPMRCNGARFELGEPPAPKEGKPLYRLPELLSANARVPVWIVEGEKCADLLAELGLTVTTSGGAASADAADWTPCKDRRAIVWPDNDAAGAKYAESVCDHLRTVGCTVETIDAGALGLPDRGDCVDWLAEHSDATPAQLDKLPRTIAASPSLSPAVTARTGSRGAPSVELISASSVNPEAIRWLWPEWLARGKFHVLAGASSTGKTTLSLHFAACVSAGLALPGGWRPERGRVLIWSGEDDPSDTLVPRLIAAGADLSRVSFVGDVHHDGGTYPFDPASNIDLLEAAATELDNIALLIIDPLVSAVAGDSHRNAEVRRSLAPLVQLAARLDAALLGISHYSKGTQAREPLERVSGSLAFGAMARVVLGTVRMDAEGADHRKMILARCKSNNGPDGGGFTYGFEEIELPDHVGLVASRIVWGAAVEGTARELLSEEPEHGAPNDAASFLRELLTLSSMPANNVFAEARAAGYSRDTMHRAKRKIGAQVFKAGMTGGWLWRLSALEGSGDASEDGAPNRRPPSQSSRLIPPSSNGNTEATAL